MTLILHFIDRLRAWLRLSNADRSDSSLRRAPQPAVATLPVRTDR